IKRLLSSQAHKALARGKSILLLGPRQTGKTTFIRQDLKPDIEISFVQASARLRYEKDPRLLEYEIQNIVNTAAKMPVIFIDEIQKIPKIMDTVQYVIDKQQAQFILSGSSARKLKHGKDLNLLPGRMVTFTLAPFTYQEIPSADLKLEDVLLYGSLPGIVLCSDNADKELDLQSYVSTYLEDEIRTEAVVRNIGHFAQFLQLAAGENGKQVNLTKLSQDIGVAATTIANYFEVLVDCLIAHTIEPITESSTKRRLIKATKYLFFDMGIRRICANEGTKLPAKSLGDLFEQYVGLQLLAYISLFDPAYKLRYWRDSAGPEIDYVLEKAQIYTPIEVKWSESPSLQDAKYIEKFLLEYNSSTKAYIICRTPKPYTMGVNNNIHVIPWQLLHTIVVGDGA
ncbi:MAG TPA: AAA family ATPase, partial [Gammaproteobacteria bacterium]|nr:AAA family ATPase [Gammaproteobacteria bacterium]